MTQTQRVLLLYYAIWFLVFFTDDHTCRSIAAKPTVCSFTYYLHVLRMTSCTKLGMGAVWASHEMHRDRYA